jgi:hypothetical protein
MAAWVKLTYAGDTRSGSTGHTVAAISPEHLDEVLDRYHITPDRLLSAEVDGDEVAPEFLSAYVHHIFNLKEEEKQNEL